MIYVVMVDDRHKYAEAHLFTDLGKALARAKDEAEYAGCFVVDDTPDGWLFFAAHSTEGDAVWVVEKEIIE